MPSGVWENPDPEKVAARREQTLAAFARGRAAGARAMSELSNEKQRGKPEADQIAYVYKYQQHRVRVNAIKGDKEIRKMVFFVANHLLDESVEVIDCPHPVYWAFLKEARAKPSKFFDTWLKPIVSNQMTNKLLQQPRRATKKKSAQTDKALEGLLNGEGK